MKEKHEILKNFSKKRGKMMFSQSLSTFLSHIKNEGGMKMNHSMVNRIRGQTNETEKR